MLAAPKSTTSIGLIWTDNSSNETGFKVERATAATGPFTLVTTTAPNVMNFDDTGLSVGVTYHYRVRATNAAGDSANTGVVSATTPVSVAIPVAPSLLAASSTSSTGITLTWTDNSTDETGFKVERGTSAAGPFAQIGTSGANVTSYSDSGLTAGTSYFYRVRASNSAGDSAYTAVASATTQAVATVPAAPTNLTATAAVGSITLSWTDASANETGFKIERSASSVGPFTLLATTAANAVTYTDAGLAATPYYYQVRATNSAGDSTATAVANATALTAVVGSTTVTLYPVADNMIMESTWDPATANKAFPTGELAVGTNWASYFDPFGTFMQTYIRAESLVKFDTAVLAGKTIDSATLTLNVQYTGNGFANAKPWHIYAVASSWGSNLTYNTVAGASFLVYDYPAGGLYLNPPTTYTSNYDIKPIAANWASGFFVNNGLWFTPDISLMPFNYFPDNTFNEAFAFYSTESAAAVGQPTWAPSLTVTYH